MRCMYRNLQLSRMLRDPHVCWGVVQLVIHTVATPVAAVFIPHVCESTPIQIASTFASVRDANSSTRTRSRGTRQQTHFDNSTTSKSSRSVLSLRPQIVNVLSRSTLSWVFSGSKGSSSPGVPALGQCLMLRLTKRDIDCR